MPDETTGKNNNLLPAEGDDKVGERVFQLLAEIIKDKSNLGLDKKWITSYQLRKNKHWKAQSTSKVPLVSANLIGVHIQRTANTLTDNNPTFNVIQSGEVREEQGQALEDLQRATSHWWNETEQQESYEESVLNGETYGITIEKSVFNSELEGGLGEVETVIVDPFQFGVYPVKWKDPKNLNRAEALFHYYPLSVREIKRKYGEKAKDVKADDEFLQELGSERREISAQGTQRASGLMVTFLSTIRSLININRTDEEQAEETLVVECWVRDSSKTEDGDPVTAEDGSVTQNYRQKYPGGIRVVTCCNGGNVVLEDRGNPNINPNLAEDNARMTYLWDRFPFAAANSQKDPVNGWGMSDQEQLEWLQREFNKCLSQIILDKDKAARSKLIIPKDSGVPNTQAVNYSSIMEPTSSVGGSGIRWLQYQPSVDLAPTAQLFKDLFFLISGSFDLDQAQVPGREVIAYKAIAALLERAATMMRGKIRSYSRLVRERGRMYLSHVMNFYTEDRWISYSKEDGTQAFKQIKGSDLIVPARLTVVTGSTMPISKIQQREEAIALFDKRAIGPRTLLTKLEFSNIKEALDEMMQGPLGQAMNNYRAMGMPPQLVQLLNNVAGIPPDKIQKLLESGTVPTFDQLVKIIGSGGQPQAEGPGPVDQADVQVKQAQARKLEAEAALVIEKIATERLSQEKLIAGVKFDQQKLKLEKAKIIASVETEIHRSIQMNKGGQGVYNERGLKSNNAEGG